MTDVRETALPGVGVRYDFDTADGARVGVLVMRSGRRDVLLYSADDPDASAATISLSTDEARTLAELLGASRVAEHLAAAEQSIEGLAIDWVPVEEGAPWAGRSLSEAAVHTNTGVSVVALLGERTVVAPGADDVLAAGATAVVAGTHEGLEQLRARLRRR